MDCSIFKKRINDLLEDNLTYDLRNAMLEHIKSCDDCNTLYKEELEIDETFKIGLSVDTKEFRSLRSDIMKNIDKNRYGISPVKRLIKHFKKNIAGYTSFAAIILVVVFLVPYVKSHGLLSTTKGLDMAVPQSASTNDIKQNSLALKTDNSLGTGDTNQTGSSDPKTKIDNSYIPQFEKKALAIDTSIKFNTPWESSVNKKFSATVEGKGTEAQEEGIGSLIIKNISNGQMWSYNLINNEKQYTPKAVKWVDDENLLVVVGYGYGMVNQGGKLYILNINTDLIANADPQNTANLDDKSEITKIQSVKMVDSNNLSIQTEVHVYKDSSLNDSYKENRTITSPFSEIVKSIKQ